MAEVNEFLPLTIMAKGISSSALYKRKQANATRGIFRNAESTTIILPYMLTLCFLSPFTLLQCDMLVMLLVARMRE